jgi:hypothetical protein
MATQLITALAEREAALAPSGAPDEDKARMAAHVERLELEVVEAKAAIEASQRAQDAATAELRESVARLEADLEQATRERDEVGAQLQAASEADALAEWTAALASPDAPDETKAQMERLELGLIDAKAAIEALQRDAALASSGPLPRATDESRHLVFFPVLGRGYVLLERPGPVPAVGDVIDTSADGGSAFGCVTKVAQPPIPGPRLRCAYLL